MEQINKFFNHLKLKLAYSKQGTVGDCASFVLKNHFPPNTSDVLKFILSTVANYENGVANCINNKDYIGVGNRLSQKQKDEIPVQLFKEIISWGVTPSLKGDIILHMLGFSGELSSNAQKDILDVWLNHTQKHLSPSNFLKYLGKIKEIANKAQSLSIGFDKIILEEAIKKYVITANINAEVEILKDITHIQMNKKVKLL